MKMHHFYQIFCFFLFILILLLVISDASQESADLISARSLYRSPRSISGLWRRLIGRRKNTRTGFQGTAIANHPFSSQPSSFLSTYFPNPFSSQNNGGEYGGYASASEPSGISGSSASVWSPKGSSYTNIVHPIENYPQAGSSYATYTPPEGPNNVDFHAVLDQFVRSAGLSPHGDHDTAASTIQAKGDTPVFSFKKLYSFPFYLSTDNHASDGFNLQIPYMKKHIRRMFQEGGFKNPKFSVDKQSIQNWLHPKSWYFGASQNQRAPLPPVHQMPNTQQAIPQNIGQWMNDMSNTYVPRREHPNTRIHYRPQQAVIRPQSILPSAPTSLPVIPSSAPSPIVTSASVPKSIISQQQQQHQQQHQQQQQQQLLLNQQQQVQLEPIKPTVGSSQSSGSDQAQSGQYLTNVAISPAQFTQYLQDTLANANVKSQLSQLISGKDIEPDQQQSQTQSSKQQQQQQQQTGQSVYIGQHAGYKGSEKTMADGENRYQANYYYPQSSGIKQLINANSGSSSSGQHQSEETGRHSSSSSSATSISSPSSVSASSSHSSSSQSSPSRA
ncbi:uncharacterized protein LOC141858729 isoform X2 [Brevipalpus obovatus]|uniref:uncharacterized protein LOC141858729 isoform X2 n=1 Tax=Brevipalpus obovatus TaxID=246614 RepID=UPI003D9E25A8